MRPFLLLLGIVLLTSYSVGAEPTPNTPGDGGATDEMARQEYERLLERYPDWTFQQLQEHLKLESYQAQRLSFDPEQAAHYDAICRSLQMTEPEQAKFKTNGFVVVDPKQRHSFGSVYYQIYASHLPVLVTTDSVLHAWHRSYDNLLRELESEILMPALASLLKDCHERLEHDVRLLDVRATTASDQDVDLYLTVARNLLAGAGDQQWDGKLIVPSVLEQDGDAIGRLADIKSLRLQVPFDPAGCTNIYGGRRCVDYSQFHPRGHYNKSTALQNYFRCLMWLGRADCGFNVLPVDPSAGIDVDWRRELRDAALLSQLVRDSGNDQRLNSISSILQLLVGESDNLTVAQMLTLFESEKITSATQLANSSGSHLEQFADAIRKSGLARQRIRSQAIVSNPNDTYKVPPPALFQMFGQVITVDSLVLSHSVFDSIIFEGKKQPRMMPCGLDVAAALGNDYAVAQLEPELRKWNYSANLLASRDFIGQLQPQFWNGNVYHRCLDALRTLDDPPESANLPEVMQGPIWRAKQLQTQLASWSELRHDNVLYGKQSFTAIPLCQYPDGFVEPYPELYNKLGELATATAVRLGELKIQSPLPWIQQSQQQMQDRQIVFLHRFAEIMDQLETIARQELAAQPMTDAQRRFIEATIDRRGSLPLGSGTRPRYDGWYCELLYNEAEPSQWDPTIVDVHTNPADRETLHVGVGDVNLAVIAVDSQDDVAAYVGPVYSYYEFTQPAEQRLTDEQWQQMIAEDKLPPRPAWTKSFTVPPAARTYNGLSVQSARGQWIVVEANDGWLQQTLQADCTDEGLRSLLNLLDTRGFPSRFGIALGNVSQTGLQMLVDVKQLTWIDATGSRIPAEAIADFCHRRPDVVAFLRQFGVQTVAVCRQIDGLRRFATDTSGKLEPGQTLLLYVEPANLTCANRGFSQCMKLAVKTTLSDASGAAVVRQVSEPLELPADSPDDLLYTTVKLPVPRSLKRGAYKLQVELTDALSDPVRTATAEIALEY